MKALFLGGLWHGLFRDVAERPDGGPYNLPVQVVVAEHREIGRGGWQNPDSPLRVVQKMTSVYELLLVDVGDQAAPVGIAYVAGDYTGPPLWSDPAGAWELFDHSPSGG